MTPILQYLNYATPSALFEYMAQFLDREYLQKIKMLVRGHRVLQFTDRDRYIDICSFLHHSLWTLCPEFRLSSYFMMMLCVYALRQVLELLDALPYLLFLTILHEHLPLLRHLFWIFMSQSSLLPSFPWILLMMSTRG